MMTHDEISRFFSEEDIKKAFQFPNWPAGTEVVCYCRSTDSRDTIEQIAKQRQWKIVDYVYIDDEPIVAMFHKPGQVVFFKREALEWKHVPTPMELTFGDLRPSGWDKFKAILLKGIRL